MGSSRHHAKHHAPRKVVLARACPLCSGDLQGAASHHYVCPKCKVSFSEEYLVRAGKLMRRTKGAASKSGVSEDYYPRQTHPR